MSAPLALGDGSGESLPVKVFHKSRRLFLIGGAAFLAGAFGAFAQARLIYFPTRYSKDEREAMQREGLRRVEFETSQGEQVAHYKGPAKGVPAKIWLAFGGNGARATDYRELALHDDFGYLFIDYPGYGSCDGKPGPRRIDASVVGAVSALGKMVGADEKKMKASLCAFGHSLGAAVALRSAAKFEMGELVIVSPFTSMKAMGALMVGKLLSNAVLHRFDNVKALTALVAARPDSRVTLFHGTADQVVPFAMGHELSQKFPKNITFVPIKGNGHNDIVSRQHRAISAAMGAVR